MKNNNFCGHIVPAMLISAAAVLAVAGCAGGGDSPPVRTVGIVEGGNVKGLRFSTRTRTGTTDANGAFTYLPGETVTFSIGGLRLGTAPAAAKVSLFMLAGATPPTTELELRRELDRATRLSTRLSRAMNLAHLLIALDADGNPDNGIDLTDRDSQLATIQIDFDLGVNTFARELDRIATDINRNVPMWRSLTFLYSASDIVVPAHSPVRREANYGGSLTVSTVVSYFPNGLLQGQVSKPDLVVLGLPDSSSAFTYDGMGRLSSQAFESVNGPVGGPLNPASVYRTQFSYDARGNEVSSIEEQEAQPGTLSRRITRAGTADSRGLFAEETSSEDSNGDGTVDTRTTVHRTFDARGNPITTVIDNDTDGDGRTDDIIRFTDVFDADDHLRSELYESDSNADGIIDSIGRTTYQPPANKVVEWQVEWDEDNDGVVDQREFSRTTYDDAGNQIAWSSVGDHGTDDTAFSRAEFLMTYDSERRLLSRIAKQDFDVDGVADQTDTTLFGYDGTGNLLTVERLSDATPPFAVARQLQTYEYGASGERTSSRSRLDIEGDGVLESDTTTQVTPQLFSNGVLMLGYQYFEGAEPVMAGGGIVVAN